MNTTNRRALIAWIAAAVFTLVALIAAVAQPLHWKRTVALAIVLGVACAAGGVLQSRNRLA